MLQRAALAPALGRGMYPADNCPPPNASRSLRSSWFQKGHDWWERAPYWLDGVILLDWILGDKALDGRGFLVLRVEVAWPPTHTRGSASC